MIRILYPVPEIYCGKVALIVPDDVPATDPMGLDNPKPPFSSLKYAVKILLGLKVTVVVNGIAKASPSKKRSE